MQYNYFKILCRIRPSLTSHSICTCFFNCNANYSSKEKLWQPNQYNFFCFWSLKSKLILKFGSFVVEWMKMQLARVLNLYLPLSTPLLRMMLLSCLPVFESFLLILARSVFSCFESDYYQTGDCVWLTCMVLITGSQQSKSDPGSRLCFGNRKQIIKRPFQ